MQNRKSISVLALIILLLISMSGCGSTSKNEASPSVSPSPTAAGTSSENQGYDVGNVMPDFLVSEIDKTNFKLSEHTGKIVFINLFATWCGPCMNEMPDIQKLYQTYGENADFIAIDVGGDDISADTAFVKKNGYTLPIGNSPDGSFGSYSVQFIPQTFILDTDGKIAYYFSGETDYSAFSSAVEELLNK